MSSMHEKDLQEFTVLLNATCSLLSRGSYQPNSNNTSLFFRSLEKYSIEQVRGGFSAHISDPQRGRFVPTPADVIGQIEGLMEQDGRPGDDEAWAMAIKSRDENETVVWTDEMAQAWAVARSVFEIGDDVGARMAFKEAYTRMVQVARKGRIPTRWTVSEGFDQQKRLVALQMAADAGVVPRDDVALLAGPSGGLLELSQTEGCPPEYKEKLLALKESLKARSDVSYDYEAKLATDAMRDAMNERVRAYTGGEGNS
jgi:hypothetical protein